VQAAMALATFGPEAKSAVPNLVNVFRDSQASWEVRRAAAVTLGTVAIDPKDGPNPQAVAVLTDAVRRDTCSKVRLHALTALILLGRPPSGAEADGEKAALRRAQAEAFRNEKSVLETAIKDPDKLVSLWARVALMRIEKVTDAHLIQVGLLLKSADVALQVNAAQALGAMGTDAKSQIKNLIDALRDKEPSVVMAAAAALAGMGDAAKTAVPALKELESGQNELVKVAAAQALARINKTDKAETPKPAGK
jgi:HEAT repeat protein